MGEKIRKLHHKCKRAWHFLWHDDSLTSWLLNIVIAFVVIYFIVYPLIGAVFGTSFPIVAVLSESMEHGLYDDKLCEQRLAEFRESFDNYWDVCGSWYEERGISKEQFRDFPLSDGFNKGDVIIVWRAERTNLEIGDVLIFNGNRQQPIIHRIVAITEENGNIFYQTKGDHNSNSIESPLEETRIGEERIFGQGILRLPYFGWVKILFVDLMSLFGVQITR